MLASGDGWISRPDRTQSGGVTPGHPAPASRTPALGARVGARPAPVPREGRAWGPTGLPAGGSARRGGAGPGEGPLLRTPTGRRPQARPGRRRGRNTSGGGGRGKCGGWGAGGPGPAGGRGMTRGGRVVDTYTFYRNNRRGRRGRGGGAAPGRAQARAAAPPPSPPAVSSSRPRLPVCRSPPPHPAHVLLPSPSVGGNGEQKGEADRRGSEKGGGESRAAPELRGAGG